MIIFIVKQIMNQPKEENGARKRQKLLVMLKNELTISKIGL